jgi:hypothetical protein
MGIKTKKNKVKKNDDADANAYPRRCDLSQARDPTDVNAAK